ncbi:MAG: hypothetical protein EU981_02635 [Candidatus Liberibacter ctenarytainae]|uniref:Uncharacterized protein n=1 Tax=Candidatus Liberibacter ctenarytainae TaxID=2020335 RepID=A0A937AQA3_9HYPH|nr:hypothetical protein [Candidatus Liberibacter ctenarytainae]
MSTILSVVAVSKRRSDVVPTAIIRPPHNLTTFKACVFSYQQKPLPYALHASSVGRFHEI